MHTQEEKQPSFFFTGRHLLHKLPLLYLHKMVLCNCSVSFTCIKYHIFYVHNLKYFHQKIVLNLLNCNSLGKKKVLKSTILSIDKK